MDKLHTARLLHAAQFARDLVREFKFILAALAIGSQTVPLADNRQLVRDLAARAAGLYGETPAKLTGGRR
jgi:hypothetical protein